MESNLTAVQRLAKQFENLAAAQTKNDDKQQKCNWWLEGTDETAIDDKVETDEVTISDSNK